jgi:hypothetical protein
MTKDTLELKGSGIHKITYNGRNHCELYTELTKWIGYLGKSSMIIDECNTLTIRCCEYCIKLRPDDSLIISDDRVPFVLPPIT